MHQDKKITSFQPAWLMFGPSLGSAVCNLFIPASRNLATCNIFGCHMNCCILLRTRDRQTDRVVSALQPTWLIGLGRARTRDQPVSRRKGYPDRFRGSPPRSSVDAHQWRQTDRVVSALQPNWLIGLENERRGYDDEWTFIPNAQSAAFSPGRWRPRLSNLIQQCFWWRRKKVSKEIKTRHQRPVYRPPRAEGHVCPCPPSHATLTADLRYSQTRRLKDRRLGLSSSTEG